MARRSLDQRLEEVARLCAEAESAAVREGLRRALEDRHPLVVARAARCAGQLELSELEVDLVAAFGRLLDAGGAADAGCSAKIALAETLCRLEAAACDAIAALAVYRRDQGLRRRLESLVARRKDRRLRQAFEDRFG